jgi:hypothetical protein
MKQAIAGVAPTEFDEVTMMVVWPSIAATAIGRFCGRLYAITAPDIYFLRIGNLLALCFVPVSLALYFRRLLPSVLGIAEHGVTYRVTNRRIIEERNEVNLGPVSFLFRLFIGVKTIATGVILYLVLPYVADVFQKILPDLFQLGLPDLGFEYLGAIVYVCALILSGILVVAGIVPIALNVPGPVFTFGIEGRSVALDRFDAVEISVRPGQAWYKAGDLIFTLDGLETFRLEGVSRPEPFRSTCVKAQMGFVGVQKALSEAVNA